MAKERLYDNLKSKVLEINSTSSSLIEKAKQLKTQDIKFSSKINEIDDLLLDKMKHGDALAYSIYYAEHEKLLEPIQASIYKDQGEKFLSFINSSQISQDDLTASFFDYKVAYIAEELKLAGELDTGIEEI